VVLVRVCGGGLDDLLRGGDLEAGEDGVLGGGEVGGLAVGAGGAGEGAEGELAELIGCDAPSTSASRARQPYQAGRRSRSAAISATTPPARSTDDPLHNHY
jgi:hypothetical protein